MSSCASEVKECREVTILSIHELELEASLASLSSHDFIQLSNDLSKYLVITRDVAKIFVSLDYNRINDSAMIARYFLHQIFENIRGNSTAFNKAMKIFSGLGGNTRKVVQKINKHFSTQATSQAAGFPNGTILDDNDVYILMDILVACSYKWETLGIAIRLPRNVLQECRSGDSNTARLYRVISEWVTGKYEQAKEATLNNLKAALASSVVGEGSLALDLEEKYREAKHPSTDLGAVSVVQKLGQTFEIKYFSGDHEVTDGKSTLLEVQVYPTDSVSYQWMKNGQFLSDNCSFSGSHSNFLCITKASQGTEGEYHCKILHENNLLQSPVATVTLVYDEDKQSLLSSYSSLSLYPSFKEITGDLWPQIHCSTFIDIALVKASKLQHKGSTFFTEGDIDNYLESKKKIKYEDAFNEYKKGALVLIEGRPGSGKTTLARKLAKDWAKGIVLRNVDRLFLVSLRKKQDKLKLFKNFYPSQTEVKISMIEESRGNGVCFILDGYDEYSKEDENSIIDELLLQEHLSQSMVIVTSRPIAAAGLRLGATERIKILGFTKKNFNEYVEHYPFGDLMAGRDVTSITSEVSKYLERCSQLLKMCYLPVNASMICFICSQQLDKNILNTETQVYESFVIAVTLRKLIRRNPKAQLCSLKDLEGDNQACFQSLCTLAFNMTVDKKQILHDLPVELNCIKDSVFSDLLSIDQITKIYGPESVTCFLHLTLQEYLAAYHLSCLDEDKQMEMIMLHRGKDHMLTTFKFYCGLVDFHGRMSQFEEITKCVGPDCLYMCHCAYETQESSVCSLAVEILEGKIELETGIFTAADFVAVGYVISMSSYSVTSVDIGPGQLYEDINEPTLNSRHLDKKHILTQEFDNTEIGLFSQIKYILEESFRARVSYTVTACYNQLESINTEKYIEAAAGKYVIAYKDMLEVSSDLFSSGSAEPLVVALKSCKNLQHFHLLGNYRSTKAACIIADILKNSTALETLSIWGIMSSCGAAILGDGLQSCKKLHTLELSYNDFYLDSGSSLARGLVCYTNLKNLDLEGSLNAKSAVNFLGELKNTDISLHHLNLGSNNIGQEGIQALVNNIVFTNLEELDLLNNNIGSEGAITLASGLKQCSLLLRLHLGNNNISSSGIIALAEGLSSCCNLEQFDLSLNNIGAIGAAAVTNGLRNCNQLQNLAVDACNLQSNGVQNIAEGFLNWKHLRFIRVSQNGSLSESITTFSCQLKLLSSLENLYLSHSYIDCSGAKFLADALQYCPKLCILDLSHNKISSNGITSICYSLQCDSIEDLNFSHNCIDSNSIEALTYIVNDLHIEKLNLSHNNIDSEGISSFMSNIRSHNHPLKLNLSNNILPENVKSIEEEFKKHTDIQVLMTV